MDFSNLISYITLPAELVAEGAIPGVTPISLLVLSGGLFVVSAYFLVSYYVKKRRKAKELEDDINFELEQLPWTVEEKPTQFLELPPPEIDISDIPDFPAPAKKKTAKKKGAAKKKTAKKKKTASAK